MNALADERLSKRYSVIHNLDCASQNFSPADKSIADDLYVTTTGAYKAIDVAAFLAVSPGAATPSAPGLANRKTRFSRTPIGANPNFRRIAMG